MEGGEDDQPTQPLLPPSRQCSSSPEPVSSELEELLSNTEFPILQRIGTATLLELRILLKIAGPTVVIYFISSFMSLSTQIFCGHLGNLEFAASALGNSGIQTFAYGLMLGMGSAAETLCGQAYGAHKLEMLGVYLQRSAVILTATAIPLMIIYVFSKDILLLIGESSAIAAAAAVFVYGLIPQLFAYAVNFPIQKFLQAQSIVLPSAYIAAGGLCVHLLLSWAALFKLHMGLLGASLVLSLTWWINVVAQFGYIVVSDRCKYTWTGFTLLAFSGLWDFVKLSAASAVMLCLEVWYYQILVLIAGLLKNAEVALETLAVCMTVAGWVFRIAVGFNAAVSVRVSNELGAGHPKSASFAVIVATSTSLAIAIIIAVLVMALRDVISYIFTGGKTVSDAVSDLAPFLALAIIFNGVQPVLSGVAIGSGWQAIVAYINVGCYYGVGLPLGALLGFKFDFGIKGIWSGLIGGTILQTLILLWITWRTDWNKEVEKAMVRLNKWDSEKSPTTESS